MAHSSSSERDHQAYVEDYDSDTSEPVVDTFRRSSSSPAANVAAKRSHPSDLGTDPPVADKEKMMHIDLQSDSGYSSHTAGTMSSADSVPSAKLSQTSTAPSSAASMPPASPAPTTRRRQTMVVDERKKPSESPRRPLQRNNSVSSKRPAGSTRRPTLTTAEGECRDPNCTECGPNVPSSSRRSRRESTALDSGLDISYPPFDVRSQRSDPASTYAAPPSPVFNRQPGQYMQGSTMVQPAQTRPRASSTARQRPMSYHGDPGRNYWQAPGMPAQYSPPQEPYGPPPSMSAHYSMPQPQHQSAMAPSYMMGQTPPSHFYQGGHPLAQHMAAYEQQQQQRPPLAPRNSSNYNSRRPVSQYDPQITYGAKPDQQAALPSARYGNAPQSARQERFPALEHRPPKQLMQAPHLDSDDSYGESSSEDEDVSVQVPVAPPPKQIMAPPKQKSKPKPEPRPALRHAKTTQVTQVHQVHNGRQRRPSVSQSQRLPERPREKDSRAARINTAPPSRSMSVSRPGPPKRVTQSAYDTRGGGRVIVENPRTYHRQSYVEEPKASRRQSYQAYEQNYEQHYDDDSEEEDEYDSELEERRRRRSSRVYRDEEDDAILVAERPPRRRTDASIRRDEYIVGKETAKVIDDVEAYQQRTRGAYEPLSEQVHKQAKQRGSRVPSDPDRKTRVSQLTSGGTNGEIRLRVDASAPLSLSFNGDMEGRTLQLLPGEDGMADIVIGGHRGEESVYHSEKGSIRGNRNSMIEQRSARREAEEASVKSGRSSHGRRERERVREERRPLRRMTHTQQYYQS